MYCPTVASPFSFARRANSFCPAAKPSGKWQWRETFKLYPARARAVVAGILLGVGLVPVVALINRLQSSFWPADSVTHVKSHLGVAIQGEATAFIRRQRYLKRAAGISRAATPIRTR